MTHRDGVRIARRCWLPADLADDYEQRCAAALATCADGTVLSSTTAARIHGLWLPSGLDDIHLASAQPDRIAKAMTRTRRPEFTAHRRALTDEDRTLVDGLAVMTIPRTWLDLAAVLGLPDVVAAGDSALRSGCSPAELAAVIERSPRTRGLRRAREALLLLDARSRSRPESHLRVAVTAPHIPVFAVNEAIYRADGGWLAEPDLSLAEAKLALEYQGSDHATIEQMRKDITRATDMRDDGWLCLLYGPAEVFRRPWQIGPEVMRIVRQRAGHLIRSRRSR